MELHEVDALLSETGLEPVLVWTVKHHRDERVRSRALQTLGALQALRSAVEDDEPTLVQRLTSDAVRA